MEEQPRDPNEGQQKKTLLVLLAAVVIAGGAFAISRWVSGTATEMEAARPSEPPMFLAGTPQAYLYDFVEGDFKGERLEAANWLKYKELVVWPNEPNWDHAYVLRSYRIQSGPVTTREASIEVTYDTLGELDTETFTYNPSPSVQTVPYLMIPRNGKWLVGTPRLQPHVGTKAAIEYLERMSVNYKQYRANIEASIKAIRAASEPR